MPTVNPSPIGVKIQIELSSGLPMIGGKLFTYVAGSVNTKTTTYTDSTGTVANANPLILNSLGQPTTEIWIPAGVAVKHVLAPATDTDPPTSPVWSIDNLRGINDTSVTIDQWVSGPAPTFIGATQFSLVGDQTSTFQVGRRIKATVTAGTVYGRITVSAFAAVTTVTVVLDSGTLDSGLSAVSYGLLSATNPSVPAIIDGSGAIAVTNPAGRPTVAVTTGNGLAVSSSALVFGGAIGQCRLSRASATSLLLSPQAGNLLTVNGVACTIPDAGVTLAAAPAAPSTTYYIYAVATAGVITSLEASTTGWAFSTLAGNKGTPIINTGANPADPTNNTRTLVGMARGNGSTQWADSAAQRFVLNYWQRRTIEAHAKFTANRTTTNATWTELNSEIHNNFLTWADESVQCVLSGTHINSSGGARVAIGIAFDGTTVEEGAMASFLQPAANNNAELPTFAQAGKTLSEGLHYSTVVGSISGGATLTCVGSGSAPAAATAQAMRLTSWLRG
jgi:hypothetical protein